MYVAADLADPGGDGRPTGPMTGVTGGPPLPEAVVPVSEFRDHGGLDTKECGWCFGGMAASQRKSSRGRRGDASVKNLKWGEDGRTGI